MPFKTYDKLIDTSVSQVVVDNSVAMRWIVEDGSKKEMSYSKSVLDLIGVGNLIAPELITYEASNVINRYLKNTDISYKHAMKALGSLYDMLDLIVLKKNPAELLDFSFSNNVSTYDAAYLILAKESCCQLATLDKQMIKAAKKLNIELF